MVRPLQAGETGALLALLDHWPIADGWRARDFFRRYIERDPSFEARNVWVAEEDGRLVSCVQIFPRTLRGRHGPLLCGGIGSVFTLPEHRHRGLASRLLERAIESMQKRGMEVSLLLATLTRWYGSFGWHVWSDERWELSLQRPDGVAPEDRERLPVELGELDRERDLAQVTAIAEGYSGELLGTVVRDENAWRASLELAGNPQERFLVARERGRVCAYLRSTELEGRHQITEWGRMAGDAASLAALFCRELDSVRGESVLAAGVADDELFARLRALGVGIRRVRSAAWMLRVLDEPGLRARLPSRAVDRSDDREPGRQADLLEEWLPRDRFAFWTADRF